MHSRMGWAQRCQISSFVELGRRISEHSEAIGATLDHRLSKRLVESTNTKIRARRRWPAVTVTDSGPRACRGVR